MTDAALPGPEIAPFPYFGGKRRAVAAVWAALGPVRSYVEPFCGSAAVLLGRPVETYVTRGWPGVETINDASGMVANFWRAVRAVPAEVAALADYPVSELDLHARHRWLVDRAGALRAALEADPDYFEAKTAAWWAWGASAWIGDGWCPEDGTAIDVKLPDVSHAAKGLHLAHKMPNVANAARGVQLPARAAHPDEADAALRRTAFADERVRHGSLDAWMASLARRLRNARVTCGDWKRVAKRSVLFPVSEPDDHVAGVFLDPPYDAAVRGAMRYAVDGASLSAEARAWCVAEGDNPRLRIVLAGEAGEHAALEARGWRVAAWQRKGGYSRGEGRRDERLWLSPHCVGARQQELFA